MDYRHERKHEISFCDLLVIRARLGAVAKRDPHAPDGSYEIRSLYFENPNDKALREKLNGINRREKFRIRFYNGDTSCIHLEKKERWNGLGRKISADLTRGEVCAIIAGETGWMIDSSNALVRELYEKMKLQQIRPRTIVDYTREPFVYDPGNVRVTLDYHIRTGLFATDCLDGNCVTIPVPGDPIILEVKWDEFLPSVIRDAVQLEGRHTSAFSKYAACRSYG